MIQNKYFVSIRGVKKAKITKNDENSGEIRSADKTEYTFNVFAINIDRQEINPTDLIFLRVSELFRRHLSTARPTAEHNLHYIYLKTVLFFLRRCVYSSFL